MKAVFATILVLLLLQMGSAQIIQCKWSWADKYLVIAESGLNLRDAQSLEGKVITALPFGADIRVCYEDTKTEVIDGEEGKWVRTFWQDKEGFVFDRHIAKQEDYRNFKKVKEASRVFVDLQFLTFSKDEDNVGLFKDEGRDKYVLRKMDLRIGETPDVLKVDTDTELPIWIFKTFQFEKNRMIKGKEVNRTMFVGEKLTVGDGTLYCDGELVKTDSSRVFGFEIAPYELRYQSWNDDEIHDELLLKMHFKGGIADRYGYEAKAEIAFIGDLDGDGEEDILLTFQHTYKGAYYALFSTRYARPGRRFEEFIIGSGSCC